MQPERELPVLWRRVVTWMAGERAFPRMEADRRQTFREIISKSAEYSLDRLITLEDRAAEPIAQSDVGLLRPTRFERTSFGDILGFFHLFIQPPLSLTSKEHRARSPCSMARPEKRRRSRGNGGYSIRK
jgi:hypothetical protein